MKKWYREIDLRKEKRVPRDLNAAANAVDRYLPERTEIWNSYLDESDTGNNDTDH